MIIERTMSDGYLSNSYLVADRPRGHAVLIDSGGPTEPILAKIDELQLEVTHLLCTHHHVDHIQNNDAYTKRFGCPVLAHAREAGHIGGVVRELDDGEELESGGLKIRALHTPGHTAGMLSFVINGEAVFTGDTLFRGSVGGTRAPGHTTYEDLQRSVMQVLMELPHSLSVQPGHTEPSSIGEEWEKNPFVRLWRGIDAAGADRCTAFGEPATLLLDARDYDGGRKCCVKFDAGGKLDIVPGSQVRGAG